MNGLLSMVSLGWCVSVMYRLMCWCCFFDSVWYGLLSSLVMLSVLVIVVLVCVYIVWCSVMILDICR